MLTLRSFRSFSETRPTRSHTFERRGMGGVETALFPSFSRSIPTVLRPDQKQKGTAPVLCLPKIKELPAQFLNRGGCAINKKIPFLSGADGVVSQFQEKSSCATRIFIRRLCDLLLTIIMLRPLGL